MLEAIKGGLETSRNYFENWRKSVKEVVPKDRLLEFDPKQGWAPLCEFLDVPIPDIPFPKLNEAKDINRKFATMSLFAYSVVYGLPALIFCFLFYLFYL